MTGHLGYSCSKNKRYKGVRTNKILPKTSCAIVGESWICLGTAIFKNIVFNSRAQFLVRLAGNMVVCLIPFPNIS